MSYSTVKNNGCIALQYQLPQVGAAKGAAHRSGWPFCMQLLSRLHSNSGMLFDDFVDRTFGCPGDCKATWTVPWVGFFHRPPDVPTWHTAAMSPETMCRRSKFKASRKHLRGAIAMSSFHVDWLHKRLKVPTIMVKFPTAKGKPFSWDSWTNSKDKSVLQIGAYLRNARAIYQLAAPAHLTKVHMFQPVPWVIQTMAFLDRHSPYRQRPWYGQVMTITDVPNAGYDKLLAANVVFLELFAASANNVVVECIARNTPLIVNRRPAVEDYLGKDYPLFYNDISEAPRLLKDEALYAGHVYLRNMDKTDLSNWTFLQRIRKFVGKLKR